MSNNNQHTMQDPVSQYPTPDIPIQHQPEPGLDRDLEPKADHGEESYVGSGKLKGRKALITGGDSGIGAAVAIAYAREGADVAISYLEDEQADAEHVKEQIEAAGQKAVLLPGDISSELACIELAEKAREALGGVDILVNNAAKQVWSESIEELSSAQFESTFHTNIFAMFWLTKALVPHMPKGAAIINTTSIQSYQPSETLLDYATTKGAITAFTHALGAQLAPRGIRVNGVAPGPIWTPLQVSDGQPKKKLPEFGQNTPLGRPGQPAELAPAYVFLASQESSYIVAEIIGVTGGQHLP